MHPLHEQLQNPLTKARDAHDRARLAAAFPVLQSCSEPRFLALRRYLDSRPERFFDEASCDAHLAWLRGCSEARGPRLKEYLSRANREIDSALLFLREINAEWWHDDALKAQDDYELVRFIDRHVHPTYLRLIEAVLAPLSRPVAHFSRIARGKGTDGLDVWSIMQELQKGSTDCYTRQYRAVVRNGIAHGGISFLQKEIRYRDNKGNEETLDTRSVVRLCDDLLDTCNGLAVALKLFFLTSRDQGYAPPRELLVDELREETLTPWWRIEGCVESEFTGSPQLVIYARPNTRHYAKVHWSTFQSGILAEFFAPGYDRYFFSLRSPQAWPGWAAFDGERLRTLRETGASDLSQYSGIVEDGLIFYVSRPALPAVLGKVDTFVQSLLLQMPLAMRQIRRNLGLHPIVCRHAAVHRNSWGAVLNAEVVLEWIDEYPDAPELVRRHRRRIVRSAIRVARKGSGFAASAYLPIGFAQVAVFRLDLRRRRLSGFGLGSDLVCTVRLHRIRRIKSPDLMGATVENMGKWRIAWNRAWLDSTGHQVN